MLNKECLETYTPVLTLIARQLETHPEWSLEMLEAANRQLQAAKYRELRDRAKSDAEAVSHAQQVVSYRAHDPEEFFNLALLQAKQENLNEALQSLNEAIRLEPEKTEYFQFKAMLLETSKRFEEAYQAIHHALTLNPEAPHLLKDQNRIAGELINHLKNEIGKLTGDAK